MYKRHPSMIIQSRDRSSSHPSSHHATVPLPLSKLSASPTLLVQQSLNILPRRLRLGTTTTTTRCDIPAARKAARHVGLDRALGLQLLDASSLLNVGHAPLLKVLDPRGRAVALKRGRRLGARAGGGGSARGGAGVDDVVGVEALVVGVAGGPAHGALGARGDGGAAAYLVAAGRADEWQPAHVGKAACVMWWLVWVEEREVNVVVSVEYFRQMERVSG